MINAYIEHDRHGNVTDSGGDAKKFQFLHLPRVGETIWIEQFNRDTVITNISWYVGYNTTIPNDDVTIYVKDT